MREDQVARHWIIVRKLGAMKQGLTVDEMAEELGCARRTVYRDIRALESAGFPICTEKNDGLTRYRFVEGYKPGVSLEMTNDELLAVHLSRGLLRALEGTVFHRSIERLQQKVLAALPEQSSRYFEGLCESVTAERTPSRDYGSKQTVIDRIMEGLDCSRTLRVRYFSASSGQTTDREVDPYKLWQKNDALYLIGWCRVHDMVRTFLVDRIDRAELTDKSFSRAGSFDMSRYHDSAFRVIADGERTLVRVRFRPEVAYSFREKKWHPTQEVEMDDDGFAVVTLRAEGLAEIRSWVLSWGDKAEVIEPESLRAQVAEVVENLARAYGA